MANDTLTATEIASYLEVDPKALRRFIRSQDAACGKGNRYGFTAEEAKALIRDFKAKPSTPSGSSRTLEDLQVLLDDQAEDADCDLEELLDEV